ncbi:hypothetical protein RND81_02G090300 [Saponaria officinalis]|uniref:Uncharacterized protein n=1 Tax=Saponaria officinalis TaxID=3572 RepID=A0AAW1MU34_SAPOF
MNEKGDAMWPAIGIDLGTKYSRVAVWEHGRVQIILNKLGKPKTPSCVAFTRRELLVGEAAEGQAADNLANTIFEKGNKPVIAVNYFGDVKQSHVSAEEISSIVLMKMKEIAEDYLGTKVKGAVIMVPAY